MEDCESGKIRLRIDPGLHSFRASLEGCPRIIAARLAFSCFFFFFVFHLTSIVARG